MQQLQRTIVGPTTEHVCILLLIDTVFVCEWYDLNEWSYAVRFLLIHSAHLFSFWLQWNLMSLPRDIKFSVIKWNSVSIAYIYIHNTYVYICMCSLLLHVSKLFRLHACILFACMYIVCMHAYYVLVVFCKSLLIYIILCVCLS